MMGAVKQVEIEVTVKRETPLALLVDNGHREAWIPKSAITDQVEEDDGSVSAIFIPVWLAAEKGLV